MATLNVRLDDKLKKEAYAVLEKLDMTPTEAVRLLFQYIAENGRMPVKSMTISDGEAALLRTVRERLENPRPGVKVSLDGRSLARRSKNSSKISSSRLCRIRELSRPG